MRIDRTLKRDIRAVVAVEYALIAALIVSTAVYSFGYFADGLRTAFQQIGTSISDEITGP